MTTGKFHPKCQICKSLVIIMKIPAPRTHSQQYHTRYSNVSLWQAIDSSPFLESGPWRTPRFLSISPCPSPPGPVGRLGPASWHQQSVVFVLCLVAPSLHLRASRGQLLRMLGQRRVGVFHEERPILKKVH